jgi:hypothetical protein
MVRVFWTEHIAEIHTLKGVFMRLKPRRTWLFIIMICWLFPVKSSFADTVFLTNDTSADGIILSDQPDFIILFNKETYWRMIIKREFIVKIEKNDKGAKSKEKNKNESENESEGDEE